MGTKDSIRVLKSRKNYKMKISCALLATVAFGEKKVPPRHPLQRLDRLEQFSAELLNEWYDFLPAKDKWIAKFSKNAFRMRKNFERGNQRCGFYDAEMEHGGPATTTTKPTTRTRYTTRRTTPTRR